MPSKNGNAKTRATTEAPKDWQPNVHDVAKVVHEPASTKDLHTKAVGKVHSAVPAVFHAQNGIFHIYITVPVYSSAMVPSFICLLSKPMNMKAKSRL